LFYEILSTKKIHLHKTILYFSLIYADFICVHLHEMLFFFLADLRGFIFSLICADLSASICEKSSSFLADLR